MNTGDTHLAEKIGKRLRELRLERKLTQARVAVETRTSRPNVARLEMGLYHVPTLPVLARFARCFGVPLSSIVSAADEVENSDRQEAERLRALINTPSVDDFIEAVPLEAAHQRERWGTEHDSGKTPADWFWLVGYLAGKALYGAIGGDVDKAKHHTISTAAALANWHAALAGADNRMRPGIDTAKADVG